MKKQYSNLRVLSHFAILLLTLLLAVASTASWYDRTARANEKGNSLDYSFTEKLKVNGYGLTAKTYLGTNEKGLVTYSNEELSPDTAIEIKNGDICYFKTIVENKTNKGGALFSLYTPKLFCSSNATALNIGIIGPEKTFVTYDSSSGLITQLGEIGKDKVVKLLCIEDNVYIENGSDPEPKSIVIYWFVDPTENSGNTTIYLETPYIVYN